MAVEIASIREMTQLLMLCYHTIVLHSINSTDNRYLAYLLQLIYGENKSELKYQV